MWKFVSVLLVLALFYAGYEALFEGIVHTGKGGKAIKHIDGYEKIIVGLLFILPGIYIIYLTIKPTKDT